MPASIEYIGTQIFEDFLPHIRLIKSLGEGAFAQVFLIYDEIQKIYLAVKKISLFGLNDYERKLVVNEAKILSSIEHPNIIRFHSCLYDNNEENVFIFMEYAKQGDLFNLIEKFRMEKEHLKEKNVWKIVCDIAQALNYLHSNNIIHRDVKPANILQQGSTFKLADMNVSKIIKNGRKTCTNVGSPSYTSPQVAKNQFYNQKCDIWSLGVVIYELCCMKNPFTKESLRNLSMRDDNSLESAIDRIPLYYSKALSNLIRKMLRKDPKQRITIKQILHICQSQGFSVGIIPSNAEIVEFKTIIFPPSSQRWVNLVQNTHKKKENLDLTIDQILQKQSELQSELQLISKLHSNVLQHGIQVTYRKKSVSTIKMVEDQYCLGSINSKNNILKSKDKNVVKINNFVQKQQKSKKRPNHFIIDQYRFAESQDKENARQKCISTDKYRKFQRQSRLKGGISRSKQKSHGEYGFKFIKLSKDLPNLHS